MWNKSGIVNLKAAYCLPLDVNYLCKLLFSAILSSNIFLIYIPVFKNISLIACCDLASYFSLAFKQPPSFSGCSWVVSEFHFQCGAILLCMMLTYYLCYCQTQQNSGFKECMLIHTWDRLFISWTKSGPMTINWEIS